MLRYATLDYATIRLCCATLLCAALCYAMLRYTTLCYALLHYTYTLLYCSAGARGHRGRLHTLYLYLLYKVPEITEGGCEITVGGEARRWEEGKVLLFDDSFEHEVHNSTSQPRLVLIVDMWHPELATDAERAGALQDDAQRERYRGVADSGTYENTTLRGH